MHNAKNDNITKFLDYYEAKKLPHYAVFLKGKWGCGKTYFIKQWKDRIKNSQNQKGNKNEHVELPIYVSLYGMKEIGDIRDAIYRELHPVLTSKWARLLWKAVSAISKLALKLELRNQKDSSNVSIPATIDSLSIYKSDIKKLAGKDKNIFFIFDDLERTEIPIKRLLGFINYFVEHCACHVILIGDEEQIDANEKKIFADFKEKTIGRTFEISPEVDNAIETFVTESDIHPLLKLNKVLIKRIFENAQYDNLRILRQSIEDFSDIICKVPESSQKILSKNPNIVQNLMMSFIIVSFEYSQSQNRDMLKSWQQSYIVAKIPLGMSDDSKNSVRELVRKYNNLTLNTQYDLFNIKAVYNIVEYLDRATDVSNWVEQEIIFADKERSCLQKIQNYKTLSNDEFESVYNEVCNLIQHDGFDSVRDFALAIRYSGEIDKSGIKELDDALIKRIKDALKKQIGRISTMEDLYALKRNFIAGYVNSLNEPGGNKTDEISNSFCAECEERASLLPNEMSRVLETLSEITVKSLSDLDEMSAPDGHSAYKLTAIFKNVDVNKVFDGLKSMSNKGRHIFSVFLERHYMINVNVTDYNEVQRLYSDDLSKLEELKNNVDEFLEKLLSVERYSYTNLSYTLNLVLTRWGKINKTE